MLSPGQHLEFSFDPARATFSRSGTDLVISDANGAGVTLSGFFVAENADSLPQFLLPGGDSVPASTYLQSLNIDITTAAGPTPTATPPSSGEGEYADGAGDLLGGVERLGALGSDQWSRSTNAAEIVGSDRLSAAGPPAEVGPDSSPAAAFTFNARAVLYMQNEGDAPNGQPYDTRSVTVQALAKGADGQWGASGQDATSIEPYEGNELDADRLIERAVDGNGNITFRLTPAGKAWMDANGKDMVAYYTITDANGNTYVLQVVISADGKFDSSSEHNENLDPNGLAHGEWHEGRDDSTPTPYKVVSSNGDDQLTFSGMLTGANIRTGYAADSADWGKDTVVIKGSVNTTLADILDHVDGNRHFYVADQRNADNSIKTGAEGSVRVEYTATERDVAALGKSTIFAAVRSRGTEGEHHVNRIESGNIELEARIDPTAGNALKNATPRLAGVYAESAPGDAACSSGNFLIADKDLSVKAVISGVNNSNAQSNGNTPDAHGVYANCADTVLTAGKNITIQALIENNTGPRFVEKATGVGFYGVGNGPASTGESRIEAGGDLSITAQSGGRATGVCVSKVEKATFKAGGDLSISATGGREDAPYPEANQAAALDVSNWNNKGFTEVHAGGTASFRASAGGVATGIKNYGFAQNEAGGPSVHISASKVQVEARAEGAVEAGEYNAAGVYSAERAFTRIEAGKGGAAISAAAASGNAYGIRTLSGAKVELLSESDVAVTVSADNGTAHGVSAAAGGTDSITAGGDLAVTAKGQNAYGISAQDAGASNSVSALGDVEVKATGTAGAHGVSARSGGATNSITAGGDLTVTATGAPAPGTSNFNPLGPGGIGVVGEGTRDSLARNELTSLEGNLKISGSNYGVYNQNADMVLKALRGNVEISGGSYGVVWQENHWGTPPAGETELSISAGTDVVIKGQRGLALTDASRHNSGRVEETQHGAATVHADRNLTITGDGGANGGIGIEYLQSGVGKSLELSAGQNLSIDAAGNRVARGVYSLSNSGDKASISMDAGHDLSISAHTKGGAAGNNGNFYDFQLSTPVSSREGAVGVMLLSGATTTNTFKAGHNLTIGARDESNTASYAVLNAATKATFEAGETATFEAEGGKESYGLFTTGGSTSGWAGQGPFNGLTTVTAKMVRISASGTEKAYGVHTRGVDNSDISSSASSRYGSADTEIHATGSATVTAQSADSAYALYTQSGNASDNPSHRGASASTTVTGKDVFLTATGGKQAFGIYTEAQKAEASTTITAKESVTVTASGSNAWGVFAKGEGASNTVKSDARLKVTAEGVNLAQGVTAQGDGALSELSSLVRMDITAKITGTGSGVSAGQGAMGLYAVDGGKATAEAKDLHITATTQGEQWAAGARADGGGRVELTGRDIAVRAEVNAVNRAGAFAVRAAALETINGDITVNMTGHSRNTLLLEAENKLQTGKAGSTDFAAGIFAEGASNVSIKGDKNATNTIEIKTVSGAGTSAGIYTLGKDADVSILGGDNFDDISINAGSNTGMAMGIHVSKSTSDVLVDSGKGDDLVTIRARSSATSDSTISHAYGLDNAGGTITVKAVEGSVDIGTFSNKSNSEAMSAAGATAVNTVDARRVDLKAEGDGGISIGMHAQRGAANRVSASESVTVEAKGRMAHGLHAESGGANSVSAKSVSISATGTGVPHGRVSDRSTGLTAVGNGSSNTVSALEDVTITINDEKAHGLYAEEGGTNLVAGKTIGISVTGTGSLHERSAGLAAVGGGSSNTVSAVEDVTITAAGEFGHGAYASGTGASNTVRAGGTLGITATSADGNAYGVAAEKGGANTLTGADVDITIQAKHSAHGMNAQDGGTNIIHSESGVDITAKGRVVRVLNATDGGRNEISAATDVTIDGDCGDRGDWATGIHGESGGSNTITAGGDVDVSAKGGGEIAIGMRYKGSAGAHGVNRISAEGDVRIATSGAFAENIGMMAKDFGGNEICDAKSVAIKAEARGGSRCFAMYAYGDKITGAVGAFNSIHDVAGAVTLVAGGASVRDSSDTGTAGMMAYNGGRNSIYNAGSVDIQVKGGSLDGGGYGMKACGSISQVSQEMNHIHDITGKVSLEVTGSTPSYGMYASDSGSNLIENTGSVEITTKGDLYSYAMYAKDGGVNTITNTNGNALIVVIKATGGSLRSYAMFADADGTNRIIGGDGNDVISLKGNIHSEGTGKNIIDTGAGDDRIDLDGKVSGDFRLDAGDGYDILVLRAYSWAQFTDRYQAWLTANFDTLNIESIQWALNNPTGSVPAWLQDLVNNYNAQHSDAPIDFSPAALTDLAHIVAGDMNNIIDHDGDVTAAHTAQYAGDGHGLAAFGGGDDYVHVKGNVDHVDFTLGGGHNILHVDGNALSDIFGGHNGNDIRVGGSFGGVIDLGSGDDRVELGALHDGNILLGAGNDNLALSAFTGGTVDGGTGHDILTLNLGGHGGNNAFAAGGAFGGLFAPGAVQNFEELHFDLSGGGSDSLVFEGLIDSLRGLTGGAQTTLRITGDAGSDHVDTQALSAGGWTSLVDPVTGYTQWTRVGSEDENLILLIENGLS